MRTAAAIATSGLAPYPHQLLLSEGDCFLSIVVACEPVCRFDLIRAPRSATNMVLISNPETGTFIPYSLQVTFKIYVMVLLNLFETIKAEYILGFPIGAILILELRGLNLCVGAVLQRDSKVLAIGHFLSPFNNRLLLLATNHCRNRKQGWSNE